MFKRAIGESPSDFRAFEGLSASYLALAIFGIRPPLEVHPRFLEAHEQAAILSGLRPELRCNRAFGLCVFERRHAESEAEFLRALEEKPALGSTYVRLGILYGARGRFDEGSTFSAAAVRPTRCCQRSRARKSWSVAGSATSKRPFR